MSPEQAKGRPADKRSDIWAFGCVLYEMLTGTRAFEGDDVSDTMANVLTREPSWDRLPRTTPPAVRLLLRRCLRKDKGHRMQDAGSVRVEIEDALSLPAGSASAVSQERAGSALACGIGPQRGVAGRCDHRRSCRMAPEAVAAFSSTSTGPGSTHGAGGRAARCVAPIGCGVSQWCAPGVRRQPSWSTAASSPPDRQSEEHGARGNRRRRLRHSFHPTVSGSASSPAES